MEKADKITGADIADKFGIKPDTLRKRWSRTFDFPFDRFRELSEEQADILSGQVRGHQADRTRTTARTTARTKPEMSVEVARTPSGQDAEQTRTIETAPDWFSALCAFGYRVFLVRLCLWAVVLCQVVFLIYGAEKRYGDIGQWVGAFCGVFLFGANLIAGDKRFYSATDTAFWVVLLLSVPFGVLHFYTFRDYLNLSGAESARTWFSAMSAFVIEVLALAAFSLQAKISTEE